MVIGIDNTQKGAGISPGLKETNFANFSVHEENGPPLAYWRLPAEIEELMPDRIRIMAWIHAN